MCLYENAVYGNFKTYLLILFLQPMKTGCFPNRNISEQFNFNTYIFSVYIFPFFVFVLVTAVRITRAVSMINHGNPIHITTASPVAWSTNKKRPIKALISTLININLIQKTGIGDSKNLCGLCIYIRACGFFTVVSVHSSQFTVASQFTQFSTLFS